MYLRMYSFCHNKKSILQDHLGNKCKIVQISTAPIVEMVWFHPGIAKFHQGTHQ